MTNFSIKRIADNKKGTVTQIHNNLFKVKYHDGTTSYITKVALEDRFIVGKEVTTKPFEVKGYTVVDLQVETEPEECMTYDEYLDGTEYVEPPEQEFAEEYCKKDNDLTAKMYEALSDGVEPETGLIDKQKHYTNNGIQPITIMKANMTKEKYRGLLEGNILKYPLRYEDKNGLEDLKKAKTYLTWLIEDIEERGL